jgi:hypothetical protein
MDGWIDWETETKRKGESAKFIKNVSSYEYIAQEQKAIKCVNLLRQMPFLESISRRSNSE